MLNQQLIWKGVEQTNSSQNHLDYRTASHHGLQMLRQVCAILVPILLFYILTPCAYAQDAANVLVSVPASPSVSAGLSAQSVPLVITTDSTVYSVGSVVHIVLAPASSLRAQEDQSLMDIVLSSSSLEITLQEDKGYVLKYLGSLGTDISFIPQKPGTYHVVVYSSNNSAPQPSELSDAPSLGLAIEKTFTVYAPSTAGCKAYAPGDNIIIALRNYPPYQNTDNLPQQLMLVYSNENYSEKMIYSSEIRETIFYSSMRMGKYSLYADGNYLDCFIITNTTENLALTSGSAEPPTIMSALVNTTLLPPIPSMNSTVALAHMDISSVNLSFALNLSRDTIADMKAMNNGIVVLRLLRDNITPELLITDIHSSLATVIGYNESAPASDFAVGIKDWGVVWLSEDHHKIYLYDTLTAQRVSQTVPPYNASNGELGIVHFTHGISNSASLLNTGAGDTTNAYDAVPENITPLNNDLNSAISASSSSSSSFKWDIELDTQQLYFSNPESGQVFSDDNTAIKESFRKKIHMDQLVPPEKIADMGLEVDRDFIDSATGDTTNERGVSP